MPVVISCIAKSNWFSVSEVLIGVRVNTRVCMCISAFVLCSFIKNITTTNNKEFCHSSLYCYTSVYKHRHTQNQCNRQLENIGQIKLWKFPTIPSNNEPFRKLIVKANDVYGLVWDNYVQLFLLAESAKIYLVEPSSRKKTSFGQTSYI